MLLCLIYFVQHTIYEFPATQYLVHYNCHLFHCMNIPQIYPIWCCIDSASMNILVHIL